MLRRPLGWRSGLGVALSTVCAFACGDLTQAVGSGRGTTGGQAEATSSGGTADASDVVSGGRGSETLAEGGTTALMESDTTAGVLGSSGATSSRDTDGKGISTSSTGELPSSSSRGEDPPTLGFPCENDDDCDRDAGEECCTAAECASTCMVPCSNPNQCPFDGMGCAHGYCLFPCDNDDTDCLEWPGYICDHAGTLCELR